MECKKENLSELGIKVLNLRNSAKLAEEPWERYMVEKQVEALGLSAGSLIFSKEYLSDDDYIRMLLCSGFGSDEWKQFILMHVGMVARDFRERRNHESLSFTVENTVKIPWLRITRQLTFYGLDIEFYDETKEHAQEILNGKVLKMVKKHIMAERFEKKFPECSYDVSPFLSDDSNNLTCEITCMIPYTKIDSGAVEAAADTMQSLQTVYPLFLEARQK